jgi:mercuric ion transport protein
MTAPSHQALRPAEWSSRLALFSGGLAALLASACCLGPLALLALGVSGAWIGTLTRLEPYRPLFVAVALASLYFAWRRIYRLAEACEPGEVCAAPAVNRTYRALFWIVAGFLVVALVYPVVAPLFY